MCDSLELSSGSKSAMVIANLNDDNWRLQVFQSENVCDLSTSVECFDVK